MLPDLNHKSILITGGTGSFGRKFVETILQKYPDIKRVVIYSRDELKQYEMAHEYSPAQYPAMEYIIGDVRDTNRLRRACEDIDIIVHAAALKQVPTAENNPIEYIKTNILGAENVINAALDCQVQHVVALSSDKAAAPNNLYGATKLCSDKLFIAANNLKGRRDIRFSVVRYGNVLGSRGSVVPLFMKMRKTGVLPITHPDMTRFNISMGEEMNLVLFAIGNAWGGETFVPKIPSYKITDMAEAIGPDCHHEIVGIRPSEKLHEEMITEDDAPYTVELDNYFVILPVTPFRWKAEEFVKYFRGKYVQPGFRYNSKENTAWLTPAQIREQIKRFVDPEFEV